MPVQPYLSFGGRCEEALAFYKSALGAEVLDLMRYTDVPPSDAPGGPMPPGFANKILHCSFTVRGSTIMASDGMGESGGKVENCALAIIGIDVATADALFAALSEGGEAPMPIGPSFFSPRFGVVTDRFGVTWMIVADA